MSDSLSKSLT